MSKKTLCKLKKDALRVLLPSLAATLPTGKYICRKCARIAHEKDLLCKPISVDKIREE